MVILRGVRQAFHFSGSLLMARSARGTHPFLRITPNLSTVLSQSQFVALSIAGSILSLRA